MSPRSSLAFVCSVLLASSAAIAEIAAPAATPRAPVVLRVNRSSRSTTSAVTVVKTPVPPGVLIADADLKETAPAPGATEAHFVYQVINVSSGDVTIRAVHTSCGCTVAELPPLPWKLGPGGSGPLAVTINLVGRSGVFAKTVTLDSDRGTMTLLARVRMATETAAQVVTRKTP